MENELFKIEDSVELVKQFDSQIKRSTESMWLSVDNMNTSKTINITKADVSVAFNKNSMKYL